MSSLTGFTDWNQAHTPAAWWSITRRPTARVDGLARRRTAFDTTGLGQSPSNYLLRAIGTGSNGLAPSFDAVHRRCGHNHGAASIDEIRQDKVDSISVEGRS